jgi:alpha-beta hydrolase superfamily lysophospholipase
MAMSLSEWEPLWIGPASRRLYAALHGAAGTSTGVVVVPPLFHELPRSRRFIAEVAGELAAMGLPTLRFDFHGTGDSSGGGEDIDFASMHHDIDTAVAALRERTGVKHLVLLAWRGGALVLRGWLERGGAADLVVLWEPIVDGGSWLQELVESDAGERAVRPPPRSGVPRLTDPSDGQLMGFPASQRLRADLANAHVDGGRWRGDVPMWVIARKEATELPMDVARVLALPANAPSFSSGAAMDATFFLTPPVRNVIGELGQAVYERALA